MRTTSVSCAVSAGPYRADIDGLRAVSIVSVVLYHVGVPYVSGGFVGVDVFFVISGYLITSIVLAEMKAGTFSFARFYERRMRRLLPTLVVVLGTAFAVSFLIMVPEDFEQFCKSMFYVLILAANLFFSDQGGYFDPSLQLAPLLHFWSLAVEEQFYIVWPLVLLALMRFMRRRIMAVAVALIAASFAANIVILDQDPLAAFYMPHSRAWQLLAGCVLAIGAPRLDRAVADLAGLAGLALIVWAIVSLDHQTPYPGFWALVPTLGAVFVIWSGHMGPSLVGRLLGLRPLVFIGLVSYAWYLWHWPLIVFFRYEFEREPMAVEMAALVAISLALAALCWAYLETPIRKGTWWVGRQRAIGTGLGVTLPMIALAGAGYATDGFIDRFPAAIQEVSRNELRYKGDFRCARSLPEAIARDEPCHVWKTSDGALGIFLWGDSHARSLIPVFGEMARAADVPLAHASLAACPPLIGAGRKRNRAGLHEPCFELNLAVGEFLQRRKFTDVVLAARWNYYMGGLNPDGIPWIEQHYFQDAHAAGGTLAENRRVIAEGLERTVKAIEASGARVWIVMETPYAGIDVPVHVARKLIRGVPQQTLFGIDLEENERRHHFLEEAISGLPVRVIDPGHSLCSSGRCLIVENGKPLYYDTNHLSKHAGARIAPLFTELFAQAKKDASGSSIAP